MIICKDRLVPLFPMTSELLVKHITFLTEQENDYLKNRTLIHFNMKVQLTKQN